MGDIRERVAAIEKRFEAVGEPLPSLSDVLWLIETLKRAEELLSRTNTSLVGNGRDDGMHAVIDNDEVAAFLRGES